MQIGARYDSLVCKYSEGTLRPKKSLQATGEPSVFVCCKLQLLLLLLSLTYCRSLFRLWLVLKGTIMRVHMMRRSFETWKQLSSRGNGNYDQVLLYVQKALFFYAWRRKARDYTRMYMVIMRLLTSMEHRVKRAAFNSWLFASAYHWVAQNRTFGLARMMIKNLQRRSFRRWALHVSPRAAEWRVGRGKLTYDLLCVARLRILKVAKRFWRYRVGLEVCRRGYKHKHTFLDCCFVFVLYRLGGHGLVK